MKLIKQMELLDAITEYKVSSITSEYNSLSFIRGCEFTESLLLPKMIEFTEWVTTNGWKKCVRTDSIRFYNDLKLELGSKTTSELLNIWIEQTKNGKK